MFLTKENLAVHAVASDDATNTAFSGVLVDPKRNVTVACDGKRLVEIGAPLIDPKTYPASGVKLANGTAKPFILPAQTAQEIAKVLPKGKDESDPIRCAALATGKDGKPVIVTTDGKKTYTFPFAPIDATYPEYEAKAFPKGKPQASIALDPDLFRGTLKAAALGKVLTLHVLADRVILEAKGPDGTHSRAVVMARSPEAANAEPKKSASVPKAPAAEKVEPSPAPTSTHRSSGGYRRRWRTHRSVTTEATAPGEPTLAQRAFHTFLLKSRGNEVAVEDLRAQDALEKIEALKQSPAQEENFATWLQWKKLFFLLAEKKAKPEKVCDVLNGLTDIQSTSSTIEEWLARDVAAEAA